MQQLGRFLHPYTSLGKGSRVSPGAACEGASFRYGCGGHLPTAYFFAGGRAKLPSVKLEAYCLFFDTRFSWMAEGILEFAYGGTCK